MKPKNPLIVMALESESQGIVEQTGLPVLYCGVGKVNATYKLVRHLTLASAQQQSHDAVINLGSAGSGRFNRHELIAAENFIQIDMNVSALGFKLGETPFDPTPSILTFPRYFHHLPHGTCATGDSFQQNAGSIDADIFEMEAYALAKVCHLEQIPFYCVKYITDGADASAANNWQENLKYAARAFSELLNNAFHREF